MSKIRRVLVIVAILASLLFIGSVVSFAADDYPSNLKNAAKDSLVDPWNFYNRECTSFAAWCLNNRNGVAFHNHYGGVHWGNAKNWGAAAKSLGITVDMNPAVGSIAWWTSGNGGHVAWVSAVSGNNVTVEEYNQNSDGKYHVRTFAKGSASGYIHIKDSVNPVPPATPTVSVSGQNVTVKWNDVANESSYDVYLVQAPWGWGDIKYRQSVSANTTSCTFSNVAIGDYAAFVISRPNADNVQSQWSSFSVKNLPVPAAPVIKIANEVFLTDNTITVSWNSVQNASKYTYYLSEYPEGYAYQTNVKNGSVTGTYVNFSNLPNGRYRIFVHAVNANGASSPQSNWLTFYVYDKNDYIPKKVGVYNDHLYAVYDNESSWDFAFELSGKMGGHLATISNSGENQFIYSLISSGGKSYYHIGARNDNASNYDTNSTPWRWVTGEAFSYTNWASGEPSGSGSKATREHFGMIYKSSGQWNDAYNTNKYDRGFIVEYDNLSSIKPTYTLSIGNRVYRTYDTTMTWSAAKAFCETVGGHLATAEDSGEYTLIHSAINQGKRAWYWLGGTRTSSDGSGKWLNGSSISKNDGTMPWSTFNLGGYLFAYKNGTKGLGWMRNTYHPVNDMKNIGFICEMDKEQEPVHTHSMEHIDSKAATCTASGNNSYWYCSDCGKYFLDSAGNNEVSKSSLTIAAFGHDFVDGTCARCGASDPNYVEPVDPMPVDPEPMTQPNPFVDVYESDSYYDAVQWAYYSNPQITNGIDATHFGPGQTVTRGQCVAFLWRAMGCPEPTSHYNPFKDVPSSQYYYKPVLWAIEEGITKGTSATAFSPNATLSTQHIITFLYRAKNPGQDGWSGDAYYWAADNKGRPFGVNINVDNNTPCPRGNVVQFLQKVQ